MKRWISLFALIVAAGAAAAVGEATPDKPAPELVVKKVGGRLVTLAMFDGSPGKKLFVPKSKLLVCDAQDCRPALGSEASFAEGCPCSQPECAEVCEPHARLPLAPHAARELAATSTALAEPIAGCASSEDDEACVSDHVSTAIPGAHGEWVPKVVGDRVVELGMVDGPAGKKVFFRRDDVFMCDADGCEPCTDGSCIINGGCPCDRKQCANLCLQLGELPLPPAR
jgi:hypothetical protein